MALFPDARFVFLWRNPLAVAASMIESFGRGHWNLDRYDVDLHGGLERLVAAAGRGDERAIAVRFEDVVADPDAATAAIFRFLELEPAAATAAGFGEVGLGRPDGRPDRHGQLPGGERRAARPLARDDGQSAAQALVRGVPAPSRRRDVLARWATTSTSWPAPWTASAPGPAAWCRTPPGDWTAAVAAAARRDSSEPAAGARHRRRPRRRPRRDERHRSSSCISGRPPARRFGPSSSDSSRARRRSRSGPAGGRARRRSRTSPSCPRPIGCARG